MNYVALLRGINVGGNSKVAMAELKACFERAGFTAVKTYINSGNVLFSAGDNTDDHVETIEKLIEATFGFRVAVLIVPVPQLHRIAQVIPAGWLNNTEQKTDVVFLWPQIDAPTVIEQIGLSADIEQFIYVPGALVWNISRKNVTKSKLLRIVGTDLYKQMTVRNVNTVRKLVELSSTGI